MPEWLGIATLDSYTIDTLQWLYREHAIGYTLMLLRLSLNQGPLAAIETQYQQGCVKWKVCQMKRKK